MGLKPQLLYCAGGTAACKAAAERLSRSGVARIDHPAPEIDTLLLDVPSFSASGELRCGGRIEELLQRLPERILVIGGNLNHPALDGYKKLDLLRQEAYLAENAALTADCALRIAGQELDIAFSEAKAVIIGWGRIAKCLAPMLRDLGAQVTVAARKESDRAMARSLRLRAAAVEELAALAQETDLLINTAPAPILNQRQLGSWHAVKLDLASQKGLDSEDVLWARGLPGKMVSASSGALIARTILEVDAP